MAVSLIKKNHKWVDVIAKYCNLVLYDTIRKQHCLITAVIYRYINILYIHSRTVAIPCGNTKRMCESVSV